MSVSQKHSIFGVQIDTNKIGGVGSLSMPSGIEARGEAMDGGVYNSVSHVVSIAPTANFMSHALSTLITALGIDGLAFTSSGPVLLFGQKHAEGSTRAGSSAHKKYTLNKGMMFMSRISANFQGDAQAECQIIATYDGTNLPVIPTASQSLTSGFTDLLRFTLATMTLDGVALAGCKGIDIDFGVRAVAEGADGDLYPTYASIETIMPTIRFRGINLDWFLTSGAVPLVGVAAEHANTTIWLRKRAALGPTFVADGTAEHIKVTAAGCLYVTDIINGTGSQAAECNMMMKCVHDGTNLPIILTVDQAIV